MTVFLSRLGTKAKKLPHPAVCDAWLADGRRFGDELQGLQIENVLGRWPKEREMDAVVRLAQAVGDEATWHSYAMTPAVAQKLAERARLQPLDDEIIHNLKHLQQVCHRPRLHLRIEEERLPVSRARRTPVRAVADLVSHPADWEHRTLRSIQPSRVLARQIEDEWNLYENRVAVRLVDHLLAYLAKRLEELRDIESTLLASRDHSDETRSSFWRARRVMTLWANTLTSKTENQLLVTIGLLEKAQHDLQTLLDAPLYRRVPRRAFVAPSLKPTNILVNDSHYRKVAALWRVYMRLGYKRHETHRQRVERRQREAAAWDRFVLHLIARAFSALGWTGTPAERGWHLSRDGWSPVSVAVDDNGVVSLTGGEGTLRLLPLCTDFAGTDGEALARYFESLDGQDGEVVAVHVGDTSAIPDVDRATGWSFGGRAVLIGCSPWGIDSEERMARLLNGWLNRAAVLPYPVTTSIRALPQPQRGWNWITYEDPSLVVLRAPAGVDVSSVRAWARDRAKQLDAKARQAKLARKAPEIAPREAIAAFLRFIDEVAPALAGLDLCPVCASIGRVDPRPGRMVDGSDATWWATCDSCGSAWGLRPCRTCGTRYRALEVKGGMDMAQVSQTTAPRAWPDRVLGRDAWAQPCSIGAEGQFRCPTCGTCSGSACTNRCAGARLDAEGEV